MQYNEQIKFLLDDIIADINSNKRVYVKNPDKDFTRDRKLPFDKVIKIILSMKGNTLNKELYDFGKIPEEIATSSAFIQQRDKLSENLFKEIFHRFVKSMTDFKTFRGYRLYAVDGSDINIASNEDSETYVQPCKIKNNGERMKGHNQYHLNAIYDLLNKVYVDALLKPTPKANERREFIDMLNSMILNSKTLFIADRGYPSWNLLTHFKYKTNADYLIRVKNGENGLVKSLPMTELDITKDVIISTNQYDNR